MEQIARNCNGCGACRAQDAGVVARGQDLLDATLDVAPGQDVSGLTVVFSDRQTDLRGTFFDSAEHPVAGYDVIVFAADRRFWTPESRRIERVTLGRDGRQPLDGVVLVDPGSCDERPPFPELVLDGGD